MTQADSMSLNQLAVGQSGYGAGRFFWLWQVCANIPNTVGLALDINLDGVSAYHPKDTGVNLAGSTGGSGRGGKSTGLERD